MSDTENVQYLINKKGIRHFKLESDLYGILDVVPYEEYEKLQQRVEQLVLEIEQLRTELNSKNNIIKDIKEYINFLYIFNQNINGKFNETQWGQDILGLIGDE